MIVERHIGGRIKERRIMLGWNAEDFSMRVGCPPKRVKSIELGKVRAEELYEIAKALRVPIGYFFDGLDGSSLPPLCYSEKMQLELSRNFGRLAEYQQRALNDYVRTLVNA